MKSGAEAAAPSLPGNTSPPTPVSAAAAAGARAHRQPSEGTSRSLAEETRGIRLPSPRGGGIRRVGGLSGVLMPY